MSSSSSKSSRFARFITMGSALFAAAQYLNGEGSPVGFKGFFVVSGICDVVLATLLWKESGTKKRQNEKNHINNQEDNDEADRSLFSLFTQVRMLSGAVSACQLVNLDERGGAISDVFGFMSLIAVLVGGVCGPFELRRSPWIGLW